MPGPDLSSIMALALMLAMTLLATTQAAPPHSSLQDAQFTGSYRSGEEKFDTSLHDEDVEQLRALKNHRTNQRLYETALRRENKNLQARASKTQRSAQTKTIYEDETPLAYFLKDLRQGRPSHQSSSRVPSYTASDLAEYIYKTGDEDGVSMALQELTQEGLMSPSEALTYLHDVRINLQYLIQLEEQDRHSHQEEVLKDLTNKSHLSMGLPDMNGNDKQLNAAIDADDQLAYSREAFRDYSDNDYSFEEVIYQLAKLLFAQTQQRDGPDGSEKMMELIIDLLDRETQQGKITPEAHDKALDVMMSSLMEVVKENELSRSNVTHSESRPAPIETNPAHNRSSSVISGSDPTNDGPQLAFSRPNMAYSGFKPDNREPNPAHSRPFPVIGESKPSNKGPKPAYSGSDLTFGGSNPLYSGSRLMIGGSKPNYGGSIPANNGPTTAYGGSISAFSRINQAYSGTNPANSGFHSAHSGFNSAHSGIHQMPASFNYPKVHTNEKSTPQKVIKENEVIDN